MQDMRTGAIAVFLIALLPAVKAAEPEQFYNAIRSDDMGAVQQMLKSGAGANSKDKSGTTPLMYAAAVGSARMMRVLIAAGADVNAKNNGESTALLWATGNAEKVRLLIEKGADVNVRSKYGRTPLAVAAAQAGNQEVVRMLLAKGAGGTGLFEAAMAADPASVALFLEKGQDVNAKGPSGFTPLMAAAANGNAGLVKTFIARGADVNAKSGETFGPPVRNGVIALGHLTPLSLAVATGNADSVRMLLDAGADVNAKDVRGMTPLMMAIATDHPNREIVTLLTKKGARMDEQSNNGETAMAWAAKFQNPAMVSGAPAFVRMVNDSSNTVDVRTAVEKSIALMQKSSETFFENGGCVSCHAQNMTTIAIAAAKSKGVHYDETQAAGISRANYLQFAAFANGLLERLDPPVVEILSYAAFAMGADGVAPDRTTDAIVHNLAAQQHEDGSWGMPGVKRPPISDGRLSATALTIRVLLQYAPPAREKEMAERAAHGARWMLAQKASTTEDMVMQLLAAKWAGVDAATVRGLSKRLAAQQREDGGWAQTPYLASDAYATGTALYALKESGVVTPDGGVYRKGVRYLLNTQAEDGSWHVASRAPKFQPYFDGGFPYGHDQWISQMATGWASVALSSAIADERAMR
jgi:ankyrin repeat protein